MILRFWNKEKCVFTHAIERMGNIYVELKKAQENKHIIFLKYFCEGGDARETEENLRF